MAEYLAAVVSLVLLGAGCVALFVRAATAVARKRLRAAEGSRDNALALLNQVRAMAGEWEATSPEAAAIAVFLESRLGVDSKLFTRTTEGSSYGRNPGPDRRHRAGGTG